MYLENSTFSINNSTIRENTIKDNGGGIYAKNSSGNITNTEIKQNHADDVGGGIYLYNTSPRFEYVVIAQNDVTNSSGGGIYCNTTCDPYFINSTIYDNLANYGGGVHTNNNSNPSFINTIVYFNLPEQLYFSSSGSPNSAKITYSDFEGGLAAIVTNDNGMVVWMGGNITDNPLLDTGYILTENSPCIDAGTDYVSWFGEVIVDLSPEDYYGAAPDMGAIEYDVPGIYSSLNVLEYGYQEVGTTETLSLSITNNSTESITISSVSFSGSGYTTDLTTSTVLTASETLPVEIYFNPTQMIEYIDIFTISWPDDHTLDIDLSGYGDPTQPKYKI